MSYPLYLTQLQCAHRTLQNFFQTLDNAGIYEKANIIVHGDHGSRIALHNLGERSGYDPEFMPSPRTLVDYFGTLYAFKTAGPVHGEYRRDLLSVSTLLDANSSDTIPAENSGNADAHVDLVEWDDACESLSDVGAPGCRLLPTRLPPFAHGDIKARENEVTEP